MTLSTSDENSGLKILIVVNDQSTIATAVPILTKLGYELAYASHVFDAMASVTASRPDIVLVSWQLKSAGVRSVVDLMTTRLKLRCIVFSEVNDSTIGNEMLKAGFANTLPPPLLGLSIHSRIQQILSRKAISSNPLEDRSKKMVFIHGEKVPKKTIWERSSSSSNKPGITVWKGTAISKKGNKSFYYFEGEAAPKYNDGEKKWNLDQSGKFYIEKNDEKTVEPILKDAEPDLIPREVGYKHLLAKCLNDALMACTTPLGAKKKISKVEKVSAILINSSKFKGYIIGAGTESHLDQALLEKAFHGTRENMASQGVPLAPFQIIDIDVEPMNFLYWAKDAEFVVTSQEGDEELAFAFLPIQHIPEYSYTSVPEFISISIGYGLIEGEPLLFDVYLHLPKNEKFILYFKKGVVFDGAAKAKYSEHEITNLFIRSEDLPVFLIYCVKGRMKGAFNNLESKQWPA